MVQYSTEELPSTAGVPFALHRRVFDILSPWTLGHGVVQLVARSTFL